MSKATESPAEKNLNDLLKLEQRARELQNAMDRVSRRWEAKMKLVQGTPEWKDYTDRTGVCESYNFGDVLA